MGIVIITIPGEAQRTFANSLYKRSGQQVDLVIIKKPKPNHERALKRLKKLYRNVGFWAMFEELYYAALLRLRKTTRDTLKYFREHNGVHHPEPGYLAKTLEVDNINSEEVFEILKKLSPELLVIWGNTIVKPHLIRVAKKAINLHMGLCPYYHGAIANQHAVISGELEHVGATIHYAVDEVDIGDILETVTVDTSLPPRDLFRELNDKAKERYLQIALELFGGKNLAQKPQDTSQSQKFMLKNWTPKTRYKLAKRMARWERTGVLS